MRFRVLLGAAMTMAIGLVGASSIASAAAGINYTCSGGNWTGDPSTSTFAPISSGNYASLTVAGVCIVMPGTVINVTGNIDVAPGAVFNAQTFSSTINVGHNITAGAGSLLGLGCLPNPTGHTTGHPCLDDPASSSITVNGNVSATNADTVLLNGITVNGNVALTGGGGDIPWPIKMNTIGGNLIISDMTPNWLGVIRNKIGGNAILTNVNITDALFGDGAPTIFVASNMVGWNLICSGLGPAVAGGFPGEVNVVGHKAIGQCANLPDLIPGG
jgi:hypothetical protein